MIKFISLFCIFTLGYMNMPFAQKKMAVYFRSPFVVFFLLLSFFAFSQPVIDKNDFPVAGTTYEKWYVWGVDAGFPGANQYYDFSTGGVFSIDTIRYQSAAATPWASFHPGAAVASFIPGKDVSIMNYYTSDNNAFRISGATLMSKDFPPNSANHFSPYTDTLLSTQYTYGHTETEIAAIRFTDLFPDSAWVLDYQTVSFRFIDVDGYGTLKTPMNNFNDVLRVRYIELKFDTLYINGFPYQNSGDTLYYFKYFAKGIRHPVVTAYADSNWFVGYAEVLNIPTLFAGCTDSSAVNFNPLATQDDGTCYYCNQVNFTVSPDTGVCMGNSVTLTAGGGNTYLWSTGSTAPSITVMPDSSQAYSVFIKQTGSCWEQAAVNVEVYDSVNAEFWVNPDELSLYDSVLFINTSTGATDYFWDFDDAVNGTSAAENPMHAYSSGGNKNITLIAFNPCWADTFYYSLIVSSMKEFSAVKGFAILSNPSSSEIVIRFENGKSSPAQITATDVLGRTTLLLNTGSNPVEAWQIKIPVADKNLMPGLYIIRLKSNNEVYQGRWLKF